MNLESFLDKVEYRAEETITRFNELSRPLRAAVYTTVVLAGGLVLFNLGIPQAINNALELPAHPYQPKPTPTLTAEQVSIRSQIADIDSQDRQKREAVQATQTAQYNDFLSKQTPTPEPQTSK